MRRVAGYACGLAVLIGLAGCAKPREPIVPRDLLPPPQRTDVAEPLPRYTELVHRYNTNVASVGRLWSATNVTLRWRDDDGDARLEEGDGKFLFLRPDRVALTVEKLGKTYLWAGSNAERFWMFDNQEEVAYWGYHRNIGRPCMRDLPLPVHPTTVPYLLGLMPLDPSPAVEPPVERIRGHYLVEPPGLRLRLLLDPQTARPVRVDVTDADGHSVIVSQLSDYGAVAVEGVPAESQPRVPARADLFVVGEEARMTLRLGRMTTDPGRFRDAAFDFDALLRAHRPDEVIQLDRECDALDALAQQR